MNIYETKYNNLVNAMEFLAGSINPQQNPILHLLLSIKSGVEGLEYILDYLEKINARSNIEYTNTRKEFFTDMKKYFSINDEQVEIIINDLILAGYYQEKLKQLSFSSEKNLELKTI